VTDKQTIRALYIFTGAAVVLGCILHLCCSPVKVQVQQCSNVVQDSSGFTFTGCKEDGAQKTDAAGELRVNVKTPDGDPDADPAGALRPPAPTLAMRN
jgi:hypothetical protein